MAGRHTWEPTAAAVFAGLIIRAHVAGKIVGAAEGRLTTEKISTLDLDIHRSIQPPNRPRGAVRGVVTRPRRPYTRFPRSNY